jgi:hypothetical protein
MRAAGVVLYTLLILFLVVGTFVPVGDAAAKPVIRFQGQKRGARPRRRAHRSLLGHPGRRKMRFRGDGAGIVLDRSRSVVIL